MALLIALDTVIVRARRATVWTVCISPASGHRWVALGTSSNGFDLILDLLLHVVLDHLRSCEGGESQAAEEQDYK